MDELTRLEGLMQLTKIFRIVGLVGGTREPWALRVGSATDNNLVT